MTLKKVKLIHGLVIRISGDSGTQLGAHVEYVERIIDTKTGAIESAKMLPPEPLELGPDALTPLIGEVVRVQQAQLAELVAENEALMTALEGARTELEVLRSQASFSIEGTLFPDTQSSSSS